MSFEPAAVNEYWKIAFLDEITGSDFSTYKVAQTLADVKKWIGILDEDQDLPIPEPEYEQFYGGGNARPFLTVEGKRLYPGKLKWKVQNAQCFENLFGVSQAGKQLLPLVLSCPLFLYQ